MRAYYYDNLPGHPRLPHDSQRPVPLETLTKLNVLYWHVPVDSPDGWRKSIDKLSAENDFRQNDTIDVTRDGLGDEYDEILREFFDEHLHEDDEIRYVVEGAGYYDVREHPTDEWIRVVLNPGDLIAIPKGVYHRFMLDEQDRIYGLRLWRDVPNWTPVPRSDASDRNTHRIQYLENLKKAGISAPSPEGWISWAGSAISRAIFWQ
ncbi:1,2-dihydroxy-3-keto-5-methylthiopentene dioxygenase [Auriscalpium vulgare]|uniref:1,2-dihydroxy-3-keto-5-methylthiopentene dioxygenase n=1 Tax=Auriscalpium vulgare TaxID=40419 RepID=A0ACB8S597_9AGAM|nr:1,2-dihydroxy-3-keto-5-methylthiopentene dioxygenase [Auriscalpium vulgare]